MFRMMLVLLIILVAVTGCAIPTSPLSVVLATPASGSTVQSLSPVMTWVSLGAFTYHLQVATDTGFQNPVVNEKNLTQIVYNIPYGKLSSSTTYFWRVRATNNGETGPWANAFYFITPGENPIPPTPPPGATGTVNVATTMDGSSWYGSINYTLSGPTTVSGTSTPQAFTNLPVGTYTLTYNYGGPSGGSFDNISPSYTQTLTAGGNIFFNIHMRGQAASKIQVYALLDGAPWSGAINYIMNGPGTATGYGVPKTFSNVGPGAYTIAYVAGGPPGARLSEITPSTQQTVAPGGTVYFTLNFVQQQPSYGRILVNATLDGAPWQVALGSGGISYSIIGPDTHSGSSVPSNYDGQSAGTYTLSFNSGGPTGSVLTSISPSGTQTLTPGGTISYTLNFHNQARGTVHVTATLNGEPWSGSVGYVVSGPYMQSGGYVPQSFSNAATGTYSVSYSSGGPPSSIFEGVTPSSQILPAGGSISFNLRFVYHGGVLPGPLVQ
jgi:hypothetical protein